MRKIFYSKSPPKVCACTDSRRNFWTTNLKTAHLSTELHLWTGVGTAHSSQWHVGQESVITGLDWTSGLDDLPQFFTLLWKCGQCDVGSCWEPVHGWCSAGNTISMATKLVAKCYVGLWLA